MNLLLRALVAFTLLVPELSRAESTPYPAPVMSASVIIQVFVGLALVLGLVFGAAWVMKRFNNQISGNQGVLKVLSATAVGQRERVVLVEIGDTWLVLGIAPGQVRALHSLNKLNSPEISRGASAAKPNFSIWLKQMMEKKQSK